MPCEQKGCGSYAVNHHCHGRDGTRDDLCDVCFWRVRAEFAETELARLRELLANAYTPKPLEWGYGTDIYGKRYARYTGNGITLQVQYDSEIARWEWYRAADAKFVDFVCDSLEDGIAKAEAWHLARVTAPLVKVEVPT